MAGAGGAAGRVRAVADVRARDQVHSRGLRLAVDHPVLGEVQRPGSPRRCDDNPYSGGRPEHVAPPTLGQHNESIREWLDD